MNGETSSIAVGRGSRKDKEPVLVLSREMGGGEEFVPKGAGHHHYVNDTTGRPCCSIDRHEDPAEARDTRALTSSQASMEHMMKSHSLSARGEEQHLRNRERNRTISTFTPRTSGLTPDRSL